MKIGFILCEDFWQRKNIGSSRIRGHWVIKYLNRIEGVEAENFVQGKQYDVLVFQKVYWKEMAKEFKGLRIFDACDPDWLDGAEMVSMLKNIDIVTVSSLKLKEDIEKFTDKPVYYIPDREDLEILPPVKQHDINKEAEKVVWFGYNGNFEVLDPVIDSLVSMGLKLKVISDGRYENFDLKVENVKWNIETVDKEIQEADIALLPKMNKGRFAYKSDNKKTHALALGVPVAENLADLKRLMSGKARQEEIENKAKTVRDDYNVERSAKELVEIIKANGRTN